ncbi:TraV family lipoprotein [Geothermobacter hydrogeniphilus]|uniref:Conjugal transfer pilus assembly protein TraV n=1 Tax=Geothermobacter hydrogeniphilus TaxID=1969733 RepID=A0A1X0XXC5_9BACT|nr:TraV family lipoprotein [Geothermobacter hydrogeniphilus]ORJ57496.1 hypothetical protein B5V00_13685 [Geothermobacter hydrogeniphilus]
MKKLLILIPLALALSGCSVLNPYEENFRCPGGDSGKCIDVTGAYEEARNPAGKTASASSSDYEEALYGRVRDLLQAPSTPVVVPPRVMRVLMLPYEGEDNELYMLRYAYIFVDRPRWVLTDPLSRGRK